MASTPCLHRVHTGTDGSGLVLFVQYFGCIFQVRQLLPKAKDKSGQMVNDILAGTVGGTVGTVLNTPLDVVKSRIQNAVKVPGVTPKYNWTFPSMLTIAREEGASALYKGFTPKVLRLAPGGGVLLLVVEVVLEQWRRVLGGEYAA